VISSRTLFRADGSVFFVIDKPVGSQLMVLVAFKADCTGCSALSRPSIYGVTVNPAHAQCQGEKTHLINAPSGRGHTGG
jgi:hypothetical protein